MHSILSGLVLLAPAVLFRLKILNSHGFFIYTYVQTCFMVSTHPPFKLNALIQPAAAIQSIIFSSLGFFSG